MTNYTFRLGDRASEEVHDIIRNVCNNEIWGGEDFAIKLREKFNRFFQKIEDGLIRCCKNDDIKTRRILYFNTIPTTEYMVAFDPKTREIARVFHVNLLPKTTFIHD